MAEMHRAFKRLVAACIVCLQVAACDETSEDRYTPVYAPTAAVAGDIYIFGVHPLHNPETLFQVYQPILDYVNERLSGAKLELEASRNYEAYEVKLANRYFHFALPNPYQTLMSLRHGYRVFGKMGDDDQFRGIILVRRDSAVETPQDLRGNTVSYPAPTALAATMLPQDFLQRNGVSVMHDLRNVYVGSQESSIMNVFLGLSAAGATWPPPWRKFQSDEPDKAAELVVKWQTEALPNNGLVVREDVPGTLTAKVAEILVSMHEDAEGRRLLDKVPLTRFEPADETVYLAVRDFLVRFNSTVREIEVP